MGAGPPRVTVAQQRRRRGAFPGWDPRRPGRRSWTHDGATGQCPAARPSAPGARLPAAEPQAPATPVPLPPRGETARLGLGAAGSRLPRSASDVVRGRLGSGRGSRRHLAGVPGRAGGTGRQGRGRRTGPARPAPPPPSVSDGPSHRGLWGAPPPVPSGDPRRARDASDPDNPPSRVRARHGGGARGLPLVTAKKVTARQRLDLAVARVSAEGSPRALSRF